MDVKKKKLWLYGVIAYASMILLITWIVNTEELNVWLGRVLTVFRPLLIGLVLAYLLNPFFRFFENKVFEKISPFRVRRTISLIFTYLLLFLIFALLLLLIVPQLIDSITDFLADTDTLKILYFLHSTDCSRNFTAQYMTKNTGVALERVVEILEDCCRLGICSKETAHLKNGEVTVYESFGDGLALAIISIAFERMCGRKSYEYNYYSENKMIRGKQV